MRWGFNSSVCLGLVLTGTVCRPDDSTLIRLLSAELERNFRASDESFLFDFLGNNAPLSLMSAGGAVTANAVVAPSVLFDEMELERDTEDLPRLPVVPLPALSVHP